VVWVILEKHNMKLTFKCEETGSSLFRQNVRIKDDDERGPSKWEVTERKAFSSQLTMQKPSDPEAKPLFMDASHGEIKFSLMVPDYFEVGKVYTVEITEEPTQSEWA
jgi:hypothetical protein